MFFLISILVWIIRYSCLKIIYCPNILIVIFNNTDINIEDYKSSQTTRKFVGTTSL